MESGIATLIMLLFLITFGPPVIFLIVGLVKWKNNRKAAKIFLILGAVWFVIGGGICATIMTGG